MASRVQGGEVLAYVWVWVSARAWVTVERGEKCKQAGKHEWEQTHWALGKVR